jgi:putative polyhydroxyalkanoic acid system protein
MFLGLLRHCRITNSYPRILLLRLIPFRTTRKAFVFAARQREERKFSARSFSQTHPNCRIRRSAMYIERRHNVGKEEAIHKIDSFLDDLMRRQFPGGVTVKEPFKSWSDDAMHFSFKARKGFIGATISGVIRVNDDSVIMDSDLPGLVTAFVSEDTIRNVINKQLDGLFPA